MKRFPYKPIECGFMGCNHPSTHYNNEYPPEGTPEENIIRLIGNERKAMYCSGCHRYTVYYLSRAEADAESERNTIKSKKPS